MSPETELQPWAHTVFERAYDQQDRREKCSRTDFYAGFRAALVEFHVDAAFLVKTEESSRGR